MYAILLSRTIQIFQALLNLAIKVTPALIAIFHKRGQVLNLALEPDH
jgi:hypothetical protein